MGGRDHGILELGQEVMLQMTENHQEGQGAGPWGCVHKDVRGGRRVLGGVGGARKGHEDEGEKGGMSLAWVGRGGPAASEGSFGKGRGLWAWSQEQCVDLVAQATCHVVTCTSACVISWGPDWSRKVGCKKYQTSCQTSLESQLLPSFPLWSFNLNPRLGLLLGSPGLWTLMNPSAGAGWRRRGITQTKWPGRALAWSRGPEAWWPQRGSFGAEALALYPGSPRPLIPALHGGLRLSLLGLRKDWGSCVSCCWSTAPKPRVPGEVISIWWLYLPRNGQWKIWVRDNQDVPTDSIAIPVLICYTKTCINLKLSYDFFV